MQGMNRLSAPLAAFISRSHTLRAIFSSQQDFSQLHLSDWLILFGDHFKGYSQLSPLGLLWAVLWGHTIPGFNPGSPYTPDLSVCSLASMIRTASHSASSIHESLPSGHHSISPRPTGPTARSPRAWISKGTFSVRDEQQAPTRDSSYPVRLDVFPCFSARDAGGHRSHLGLSPATVLQALKGARSSGVGP